MLLVPEGYSFASRLQPAMLLTDQMIRLLMCLGVGSGFLLAPMLADANSLKPCGHIRIANTTFCFLDANGDGKYQEGDEEFCLDGWVTRGGIRCRVSG